MIRDPSWPPCFHLWYVLDCAAGVRRRGRGGGEERERERGREKRRGECAFLPLPSPAPSPFCAPMFSSEYILDCVAGVRRSREEGEGNAFFSPFLHCSLPFLYPYVFIRVCIRLRGRRQKERDRRWGEEGEGNAFFSPSLHCSLPFLYRYVFIRVCITLVRRRGRGGGERRERGRGREKGRGECAFLPLPSPAPSPFCASMFSSGYVLDCVAGVRRRGTGGGERRERGIRFSLPPPPPLSPLFVPAMKTRYLFMKRLAKPCYTSFTFSIGLSLGKLIPPPPPPNTHTHTHTHFQTPFQRNLLTSSGIPRREISREQLPTSELLEE